MIYEFIEYYSLYVDTHHDIFYIHTNHINHIHKVLFLNIMLKIMHFPTNLSTCSPIVILLVLSYYGNYQNNIIFENKTILYIILL